MGQKRRAVETVGEEGRSDPLTQPAPVPHRRLTDWRLPLRVLGRAAANFREDRGTYMSAAISYYTLFSLFPLTLLVVAVFGIVLRDDDVQARVLNSIIDFLPIEGSSVEESLRSVANLGPTLTAVSAVVSLWSAGALSASVRAALNVAFEVERGRPLLRAKLIDYLMIPVLGLPLIGGIVLTAIWRLAQRELDERWNILDGRFSWTWEVGALAIPLSLTFTSFLIAYWLVPNRHLRVRYLWPGALFAALAFEALKGGFTFYLTNFGTYDVIYGSIGSVIILLFWIFVSANILIFGAEIAAEVPHVVHAEPRHGDPDASDSDLRAAVVSFLRGLVMAGDDPEAAPARDAPGTSGPRGRNARARNGRNGNGNGHHS